MSDAATDSATALEHIVAAAWHAALGVPPASRDEDFFAAGGHSLVATEVSVRLSQALGIDVPLAMVFDYPTVQNQAAWLAETVAAGAATCAPWPADAAIAWDERSAAPEIGGVLARVAHDQAAEPIAALAALAAAALGDGERIVVGVPAFGRVAPVAIDRSGDPSFATLVDRARDAVIEGWAVAAGFRAAPDEPIAALVELRGERFRASSSDIAERIARVLAAIAAQPNAPLSRLLPDGAARAIAGGAASPAATYPLTHAQERLWFVESLTPGTSANHIQRVYRVDGPLDHARFERALGQVARRHPSLRTVFAASAGEVSQIVRPELPLDHRVEPLADAAGVAELARAEYARPFDLQAGPLWRTHLGAIGPRVHYLVFTIHHLIVDALSVIVWLREVAEHYHALGTDAVPRVPALATSIAEIAAWERTPDGRARGEADLAWWRDKLAGARPLDLPLDMRRPRGLSVGRHEVHELWSPERAAELRAAGRKRGATLNVTLFAAAAAFLARLTGQRDLVCVVPAARRDVPGREAVIGLLLNLLPVRVQLDGDPSFGEIIGRASRAVRDALAHAESPYERIVAALGAPREPGRQPLLDVIVNMVPGTETTRRADLLFTVEQSLNSAQPCDLVIGAITRQGGLLDLMIRGRDDLFAEVTVQRMLKRFATLLDAAVRAPGLPLSELPIVPDDERALVATTWNATERPLPEVTVHALVGERCARDPDAIAIVQGDRTLTAGELDARSRRVAAHLRSLALPPHAPIGVAVPPSPELAIAALGVLRAGGAYVPIDHAQPASRLEQIAREVAFIVDEAVLAAAERAVPAERAAPAASGADAACGPDDPAYVVFTSGSTGRPKRVTTTHRALVNQIAWFRDALPWRTGDVSCLRSSPAFVDAMWELFGPLADGVPLAIATTGEMRDARLLAAMLARHRVTRIMIVPSLIRALLALGEPLPDLRTWLATSEELTPALVRAFRAARPGDRLVNLYGASETADQVAAYEVGAPDPLRTPLGRPIANSRVYVVDPAGELLPIGVPGELCIAGAGVTGSTLGEPALGEPTRTTFVAGERVYRSGDRGRWRCDGTLEYLGRLDHMLKIRGVRVDPAEVEAALLERAEIGAAVVTAAPGVAGEARLVAHVAPAAGARVEAGELRRRLRARLPEPLIPTSIVVVDALPLGPTGKIDRDALPPSPPAAPIASRPPAGATEHAVALAWEHVLGHPVGAEDDFFAAGGESLLAALVGARLAERFGVELPLAVLFERPTVAAQAAWLDEATRAAGDAAIPRTPPGQAVPLSFAQERLWFAMQMAPRAPAPKLRSALRIEGPLDRERLAAALESVAERQPALRTVFVTAGAEAAGELRQRVLPRVPRDHIDVDLTGEDPARLDELVHAQLDLERDRPFDLAAGPPWRTRLLRFSPELHVLVSTMHHLVTDGISLGVWRDELHEHYAAGGRASDLPPLLASTSDVAAWQRRAGDAAWAISRRFWRDALAGATAIDLPLAAPRTGWSAGASGRVRTELSEADATALAALARAEGTTVFGALLAGAAAWLREASGRDDLVIGTIAAGRDRPEVRPLVGLFLNPLPVRVDASGGPTLRELVRRAGAATRAALAHGEVPFERIVADVNPPRRAFRQPLFDVVLNHHPIADPPRLGELAVRHVRGVTAPVAPYELMIRTIARRGITVQIDFQRERFAESRVAEWLARYLAILQAMARDPDRQVAA